MPTGAPKGMPDWNRDHWEPLWAAAEGAGMVLGWHIGSDVGDTTPFRGPGGAVLNYVETTYSGQHVATKLVTSGALDRHPDLKILISEGGSTWVPFLGDRMNEAYRQHGMFVRPQLSTLPKEILYRQVYASFQHDESSPAAMTAMGYRNGMWGSDYPHLEGTYGHTQKTLHELFDRLDPAEGHRLRIGAFKELFPHVSNPPVEG
jgi:predicted TIM-barrel fold metal-dependent hydrolase